MKRDPDLLRELMISFEQAESCYIVDGKHLNSSQEELRRSYHIQLLWDEGYVAEVKNDVYRLTASGHDFIDAIRNEGIWNETKKAASVFGTVAVSTLKDIAVAFVKAKISENIGLSI